MSVESPAAILQDRQLADGRKDLEVESEEYGGPSDSAAAQDSSLSTGVKENPQPKPPVDYVSGIQHLIFKFRGPKH